MILQRGNVVLSTIFCFLIILVLVNEPNNIYGQWMLQPIPPPGPQISDCCLTSKNKTDIYPPQISIISDKLHQGNNVLRLKILDNSPLMYREIKYSAGNKNITTYLAKEHNNEYISLLKLEPPFTRIIISATDVNGNYATLIKRMTVEQGSGLFTWYITNFLNLINLFSGR